MSLSLLFLFFLSLHLLMSLLFSIGLYFLFIGTFVISCFQHYFSLYLVFISSLLSLIFCLLPSIYSSVCYPPVLHCILRHYFYDVHHFFLVYSSFLPMLAPSLFLTPLRAPPVCLPPISQTPFSLIE